MPGAHAPAPKVMTIDAERSLAVAKVQICQLNVLEPVDNVLCEENAFRLDLSLTPRIPGAEFCFTNHWAPHRFESAGKVFLLPPDEPLRVKTGIGSQGAVFCHLFTEALSEFFDLDFTWTGRRLDAILDLRSSACADLLLKLGEEIRRPGFASDVLCEGIAMQIAVHLHRYLADAESETPASGLAGWRLKIIDERLEDIQNPPSLGELAALCRLSARQLSRAFRASRGLSIGSFVAEKRLEQAKHLLANGASVKSVSYTLGFCSTSSFCYAFRKSTGMTPGQYLAQTTRDGWMRRPKDSSSRLGADVTTAIRRVSTLQ